MPNLLPRIEFLAQSLFRRELRCPHCRSREFDTLARKLGTVKVQECRKCALCFTDPIYRGGVLPSLYDGWYHGEGSTTRIPSQRHLEKLKRTVFRGTDKDSLDVAQKILEISVGDRLLEIGSSWGYFLYQAQYVGFQSTGIEISEKRRQAGIDRLGQRIVGSFEELGKEKFDVVYSAHCLEHFTDLSTVFRDVSACLAPGGHFVVEVPHFAYRHRGRRALSSVGAVHPLGFTSQFFRRNLPRYGLRISGFFDSWEDFPHRPRIASTGDVVLCLAQKEPGPVTEQFL